MTDFPADIYTEPDGDPDTLSNLGPLAPLAGTWRGVKGADQHPVVEGTGRTDSIRGTLRLVSFTDAQQVLKEGFNLYAAGEGGAPQPDTKSKVQQGFIEKSNVNAVVEMSRMMEVSRAYTSISTLMQQQAELQKNAIQQLADVPA